MAELCETPRKVPQNSPFLPTLSKSFATLTHLKYEQLVNGLSFSGLFTAEPANFQKPIRILVPKREIPASRLGA